MARALPAEQEHPTYGRHLASLMENDEAQGLQAGTARFSSGCEQLGSCSEVQGFRVDTRHRLFIKNLATAETAKFVDKISVGATVGRREP